MINTAEKDMKGIYFPYKVCLYQMQTIVPIICDQQTAGRVMRPYLNGVGYQLRLAVAIRKLLELALPNVEKPIRYKAKNGNPSRPIIDPRLRHALATLRSVKRAEAALDQWKNPELGAHPVEEDQRKIPYVCLGDSSENETERRKAHPKRGRWGKS